MADSGTKTALIAGAFGELPELLARELRAIGVRPAFIDRLPAPDDAESLFFYCGADAGPRLAHRLAAAEKLSGKVRRVFLIRAAPATADGLAAEDALRALCSRRAASLSVMSADESVRREFIDRLAGLSRAGGRIDRLLTRLLATIRRFTGLSAAS